MHTLLERYSLKWRTTLSSQSQKTGRKVAKRREEKLTRYILTNHKELSAERIFWRLFFDTSLKPVLNKLTFQGTWHEILHATEIKIRFSSFFSSQYTICLSLQCFLLCKLISEQNKSGLVGGENTMIRRGKETKFLCCLLKSALLTTYSTYTFTSTNINNKQGHVYCTAVR